MHTHLNMTESPAEAKHLSHAEELAQKGDVTAAAEQYQQALRLNPLNFAAWNNLGNLFASLKDWATAKLFLEEAEALNPHSASVQNNLANILEQLGRSDLSIDKYRAAVRLQPGNPVFRNNLGNTLRLLNDWAGSEEMLRSAIGLRENYPAAYANLAYLFYEQGRLAEAEMLYRKSIELAPDYALAHTCLSKLLLSRRCFQEGWREQEWRWQWEDFPSPQRHFHQPQWYGEDLAGKRILLHAEQGFGDTIQFVRYVSMVDALAAHVTLEVHPELLTLMHSLPVAVDLIARGDELPQFDFHCPLMSLPLAFDTTAETIPAPVPYLKCHAPTPQWLGKQTESSIRIGLVWSGNSVNLADSRRSMTLSELRGLWSVPGVQFYSFQRGLHDLQGMDDMHFHGALPETGDFAATAAALRQMDLLISVDTAVAHLAGAMAMPVWILLPYVADWRWLRDIDGSPWYPTARLFRQNKDRRWDSVMANVTTALAAGTRQP